MGDTQGRRGDTPFAAVVEEWRETWADLAPKTQVGYESILNRHLLPEFGCARIAAVGPKEIQDFMNELAGTRSPNTVRRVMDPLRNVLRVAVERRYISANPCDAVKLPPKGDGRDIAINPLTYAEVDKLIQERQPVPLPRRPPHVRGLVDRRRTATDGRRTRALSNSTPRTRKPRDLRGFRE